MTFRVAFRLPLTPIIYLRFDLKYWGLDYPPLTAYVSWACGQLSKVVEPASMALGLSRGYETASHKVSTKLFTGSLKKQTRISVQAVDRCPEKMVDSYVRRNRDFQRRSSR